VDEKHLDMDVMVSPASGGYAGIDHVSVLYVGHAVIPLDEPPKEPPPDLWAGSQEGAVAALARMTSETYGSCSVIRKLAIPANTS